MTMNPYIQNDPSALCFSTGRTSAFMLYKTIEAYGGVSRDSANKLIVDGRVLPANMTVSFQNTGREREESLEFGYKIETEWKVDLVWLEWDDIFNLDNYKTKTGTLKKRRNRYTLNDKGYKRVDFHSASRNSEPYMNMIKYYGEYRTNVLGINKVLPNVAQRMCTANLKIKTSDRYMRLERGYSSYNSILGIRYDEPNRYTKMMAANNINSEAYENVCPLYEDKITKPEIMDVWGYSAKGKNEKGDTIYEKTHSSLFGFDLQLDANSDEGNCDLCFLKRLDKIIRIMQSTDKYDKFWVDAEIYTGQVFRRDRPTYYQLRDMINNNDPKLIKLSRASVHDKVIDCICGEAS